MNEIQATRLTNLKAVCGFYRLDPKDNTTAAEDIAPYLDGSEELGAFAAVTEHDGVHYVYPYFDTQLDAAKRAEEFIGDDIFSERPVAIVNLDTLDVLFPQTYTVTWERAYFTANQIRSLSRR